MMRNDGNAVPRLVHSAPGVFRSLYPMKILLFTANTPGQLCAIAIRSMNSSYPPLLIHHFVLYNRNHGVAAAQCERTNLEECLEGIPINGKPASSV